MGQQSQLSHYPQRKISEFQLRIKDLEKEYKRFITKPYCRAFRAGYPEGVCTPGSRHRDYREAPRDESHGAREERSESWIPRSVPGGPGGGPKVSACPTSLPQGPPGGPAQHGPAQHGRIHSGGSQETLRWESRAGRAFSEGGVVYRAEDGALLVNRTGLYHVYSRVELVLRRCSASYSYVHRVFVRRSGRDHVLMEARRRHTCSPRTQDSAWTSDSYLAAALLLQEQDRVLVNVSHPADISHNHHGNFFESWIPRSVPGGPGGGPKVSACPTSLPQGPPGGPAQHGPAQHGPAQHGRIHSGGSQETLRWESRAGRAFSEGGVVYRAEDGALLAVGPRPCADGGTQEAHLQPRTQDSAWTSDSYLAAALLLQEQDRVLVNVSHPADISHNHHGNFFGLYKI
ncbi:hypothetical protein CRUP_031401 [Coryphaenoides rupestris]|nr:hypothetical protein CRUP_031401 [Coryphaenoides rupestris]